MPLHVGHGHDTAPTTLSFLSFINLDRSCLRSTTRLRIGGGGGGGGKGWVGGTKHDRGWEEWVSMKHDREKVLIDCSNLTSSYDSLESV
jgi:hypothetical protein